MTKLLLILSLILGGLYGSYLYSRSSSPIRHAQVQVNQPIVQVAEAKEEVEPTVQEVVYEIARVFHPEGPQTVKRALDCFYSESKWRYNAVNVNRNGTIDRGVAQISSIHNMKNNEWFDYKANIAKAYELFKERSWQPWYGKDCQ